MDYSILIVDDLAESIRVLIELLKEMGLGKRVYSAPNGQVALELTKEYHPDLILADWDMPVLDGLALVKALKADPETEHIPVVMITGVMKDPASMKESFDAGVHDYLRKPFEKLEFFARVSATLKLQQAFLDIKKGKEEIAAKSDTIRVQLEELQQLNRLKDRFFAVLSHDIKSPLADLEGILNLIIDEHLVLNGEQLDGYMNKIKFRISTVQTLLADLLFWAQAQIKNVRIRPSTIRLYEVAEEIRSLYKDPLSNKMISFNNEITPTDVIKADRNIISFILRNLVANALKFTPEGGMIKIGTEASENRLRICVSDTGVGMDEQTAADLFNMDSISTEKGTSGELGTGIGLKLCRDFAAQHEGKLSVKSKPGEGSKFILELPVIE